MRLHVASDAILYREIVTEWVPVVMRKPTGAKTSASTRFHGRPPAQLTKTSSSSLLPYLTAMPAGTICRTANITGTSVPNPIAIANFDFTRFARGRKSGSDLTTAAVGGGTAAGMAVALLT